MGMRKYLTEFSREQRGSVAVVTALLMIVLIGVSAFALDFGVYYDDASRLQNSLDSAVLAALQELPADSTSSSDWAAAENVAIAYAALNGFDISTNDIEPIYKNNIAEDGIIGLKATKSIVVEYNFAKVFGVDSGTVTRSSSAGLVPVGGLKGAVPLSITSSSLSNAIEKGVYTGLTLKCSSNTGDIGIDTTGVKGWFGALRFDGSGASTYANLLTFGYSGVLTVGQVLEMENGNMSGPTMDGFTARFNQCKDGCTATNYLPDCPKLIYVPVVEVVSASKVKIVSFATFFLDSLGGNGNDSYIKATYIEGTVVPDSASGISGADFGLYVGKLLD
ncbi:MAG: pilus assembly protein [Clostridia bacterium]|nr:pilus assembly protein [Clostridia bacterium]